MREISARGKLVLRSQFRVLRMCLQYGLARKRANGWDSILKLLMVATKHRLRGLLTDVFVGKQPRN